MKRNIINSNNFLEGKKIKTHNIVEQDFLNYGSVSSLENIAIVNVATVLCKQPKIKDKIRQHSLEFDHVKGRNNRIRGMLHYDCFYRMEKSILYNVSLLPLPSPLKAKVANIITPIELQILEWMHYGRKDTEYIDSIYWTNEGTIDKIKTIKQLTDKDKGRHSHSIYKLACTYCLEDSIPNLWDKLPEELKKHYLHSKRIYKKYNTHLIAYWTHTVNNKLPELFNKIKPSDNKELYNPNHSLYSNMFTLALSEGYSLAVKYFWDKLTDVEISNNLAKWISDALQSTKNYGTYYQETNQYSDILYFLVSKMNDIEQHAVLQQNSAVILNSLFTDWPWQRFLLPTIQTMWNFLDEEVYVTLLNNITREIKETKTTEQLFSELWHVSPLNFKKYFIQQILDSPHGTDVLCNLLIVKDIGTIKAILDHVNVEKYMQIIFSLVRNSKLFEVIYAGNLPLFNELIEVLSESDINCIKEKIVFDHGNKLCHKWICDDNWNMVDKFLNCAFTSQNQIDNFKNKIINKIEITHSLIICKDTYDSVNKFICWCFCSEQEINQFRKHFAKSNLEIVRLSCGDWYSFEKFVNWCFDSVQEVNNFKTYVLQSYNMKDIIFDCIEYGYDFELLDKLIRWCCTTNEEIKQYKAEFVFSRAWIDTLQRFVSNYKIYDSEWDNWELIKKLMKLFSPLEENVVAMLKKVISKEIDFDDFYYDYKKRCYPIKKEDLFNLLDDEGYYIADYESNTDNYCLGSDNDHDIPNYCDKDYDLSIVKQVLNDMINRIESGFLGENIL